jgi:sec-independent protein translocase protein TatB
MFDIGFWELSVIALVGLVVVGPERLPAVVRTIGLWTGRVRSTAARFRDDLEREFRARELKSMLEDEANSIRAPLEEAASTLNQEFDAWSADVASDSADSEVKTGLKTPSPDVD